MQEKEILQEDNIYSLEGKKNRKLLRRRKRNISNRETKKTFTNSIQSIDTSIIKPFLVVDDDLDVLKLIQQLYEALSVYKHIKFPDYSKFDTNEYILKDLFKKYKKIKKCSFEIKNDIIYEYTLIPFKETAIEIELINLEKLSPDLYQIFTMIFNNLSLNGNVTFDLIDMELENVDINMEEDLDIEEDEYYKEIKNDYINNSYSKISNDIRNNIFSLKAFKELTSSIKEEKYISIFKEFLNWYKFRIDNYVFELKEDFNSNLYWFTNLNFFIYDEDELSKNIYETLNMNTQEGITYPISYRELNSFNINTKLEEDNKFREFQKFLIKLNDSLI